MWNTAGVRSLWDVNEAAQCTTALELRAYSSRCLGRDAALVLYGGGNTSLKTTTADTQGNTRECLYVKGSGSDLSQVGTADFTALDLQGVRALLHGPTLENEAFMAALAPLKLDATAPRPSIETLLHASLPFRFVEHTHADSVLALVNTRHGRERARDVYGDRAPLVPFHHSGFALAKACYDVFNERATATTIGLILEFHGVVAFGNDARQSYENMITLVRLAEDHLRSRGAWSLPISLPALPSPQSAYAMRALRREWSQAARFPVVLSSDRSEIAFGFAHRGDLPALNECAPPTPQHAVFSKRFAIRGRNFARFRSRYRDYIERNGQGFAQDKLPDTAPRICIDEALGIVAASVDATHAYMTLEIYRHDIEIVSRAMAHDEYVSLPSDAILAAEVHYGGFDRDLLTRAEAGELPLLGAIIGVIDVGAALTAAVESALSDLGASVIVLRQDHNSIALCERGSLIETDAGQNADAIIDAVSVLHGGVDLIIAAIEQSDLAQMLAPAMDASPFVPAMLLVAAQKVTTDILALEVPYRVVCTQATCDDIVAATRWLLRARAVE